MRRAIPVLMRFIAGAVAGFAVMAGFGLWYLSRGPISLDSVAPLVAAALSRGNGISASVDHTLLTLGARGRIVILARGVHLQREGSGTLTLGDVSLEMSPRSLLLGGLAPTRIVVDRPELRLERDPSGAFHLGVGDLASDAAEDWGQKLVGDLVHPPDGKGTLGYLTELSVQDASLTVEDQAFGIAWHAADANAVLTRAADRTGGSFQIAMGQGTQTSALAGDFTYLPSFDRLVVRLGFSELRPAQWSDAAPALAGLAAVDVPISGEFRAELDPAQLSLRDAIWDLRFGKGVVKQELLANGVLAIADGSLQGGYDAVAGRINLGTLALDLAPGTVSVAGTIDGLGGDLLAGVRPKAIDATLAFEAHGLKVDDFPRLWPERANPDTRLWATQHLRDGTVDDFAARLGLHLDLSPGAALQAQVSHFDGTMKFSNLSVEYFRPLPPVKAVDGTATFSPTEINFTATTGTLGNIKATGGTARFYRLDTDDQWAQIAVTAQGPLTDALALLDTPPLYYARDIGIDPKTASGSFDAQLGFAFPLKRELPFDLVQYNATANLANVGVGAIMFNRDLSDGDLKLKLDHNAAQVDGTAKLAGAPITLSWRQSLAANAAVRSHYDVKATLDNAQRDALGLDFLHGVADGPVAVQASYDLSAKKSGRADVSVDLGPAALDIKQINLKKPAGVPAMAHASLDLADDQLTAIRDVSVKGTGIDAQGAVSFDEKGVSNVTAERVIGGANDFHGGMSRGANGGWRIVVAGKSFDASGLFDALDKPQADTTPSPPLAIEVTLDRLVLGADRQARTIAVTMTSDGPHWQRASIDAALSDTTKATLRYGGEIGERQFKLSTDDFGALMKLLGVYGDIQGGKVDMTGQAEDRNGQRVLVTQASGGDYRVVNAPTLARLLSVASFSGISALLTGQGIPFNRLEGEVDFSTGKIVLQNMRAYGGAIGINASGTIDRAAGQMNVSGTLVPAYTLNTVIGNIPLLGNLLMGGEGQGIFASNFRLFGPIDEPQISVNALSTLAPGVLRNLFLFSPRGP